MERTRVRKSGWRLFVGALRLFFIKKLKKNTLYGKIFSGYRIKANFRIANCSA
jgi:hypothetical protein